MKRRGRARVRMVALLGTLGLYLALTEDSTAHTCAQVQFLVPVTTIVGTADCTLGHNPADDCQTDDVVVGTTVVGTSTVCVAGP